LNIEYEIYEPPGIIVARMMGRVVINDLLRHVDQLAEDSRYRPGLDKLVDMRLVESMELHVDDENQFVNYKMEKGVRERRIALVAPRDISFGMSRVYQALSESIHEEVSVFRSLDEAINWLSLPLDFKEKHILLESSHIFGNLSAS
jgi:hypothetical protein